MKPSAVVTYSAASSPSGRLGGALILALGLGSGGLAHAAADPVRVVATLPDLGDLVRVIGGDDVELTVLAKGPQDPHFIDARPSFVRALHDADLLVLTGMDLEVGWLPVLLQGARNPDVQPGAPGYLDASIAVDPLEVPTSPVDRSMGDVHPYGNPHYLLDPVNAFVVAERIRDRLSELRPSDAAGFGKRHADFTEELAARLVGEELVRRHGAETLARVLVEDELAGFLASQGRSVQPGGWLGGAASLEGVEAVEDHRSWAYLARRFGLVLVGTLEPRPGIAPTTGHLKRVVELMRERGVPLILSGPYMDPRHARWVAERTGGRVVKLAHQPGGREGTETYLATIDYNVRALREALE